MTAEEWIPGMVEVTQRDANNYCRVLTALGMEEEGDPVAEIERLRAENAALKREAYAWWEAARDAAKAERERWKEAAMLTGDALRELERYEYAAATIGLRKAVASMGPNARLTAPDTAQRTDDE